VDTVPRNLAELQTLAPLGDADILAANLARMTRAWPGERLRHHFKAHKCTELARHQRGSGWRTCAAGENVDIVAVARTTPVRQKCQCLSLPYSHAEVPADALLRIRQPGA
jgi:D-serine deaminase-like pyridoxal phosphate-dependent protein